MVNALGIALIWLAAAPPAGKIGFQRLGEVKVEISGTYHHWLDRQRYVMLDVQYAQTRAGRIANLGIADVLEQKFFQVPFGQDELKKAHPGLSTHFPYPISFFKSDRALLRFDWERDRQSGAPERLPAYCFLTPRVQSTCDPTEIGNVDPIPPWGYFKELGPDPTEKYLYGAILVYDGDILKKGKLLSLRLFRFPLSDETLTSDWEMEFAIPKREKPLSLQSSVFFSADGRMLAFVEYHDLTDAERSTPVPPPQVYVIDTKTKQVSTFPIPVTAYGVSFSRDGKYLAVGSLETGELLRINLAAGRIDRRVKAGTSVDKLLTTARGDTFLVFSGRSRKPKPIQVRRWSDLKVVQTIPIRSLFPERDSMDSSYVWMSADGRHLVTTNTGENGFAVKEEGLVVFRLEGK